MNFVPKLTRQVAYETWLEYQKSDRKMNVAKKARELGISVGRLRQQFAKIERTIKFCGEKGLENYLAYRWKSGVGWSISIWAPDNPPLEDGEKNE